MGNREISEEFKKGRFYGMMRENPENSWDKFMEEKKKIQAQEVQNQLLTSLIPQRDIFSSEYMEELVNQRTMDETVYRTNYVATNAKKDVQNQRETIYSHISYANDGMIRLVVTERNGRMRDYILAMKIYQARAETLIPADQSGGEIYRLSFVTGSGQKEIFITRRDLSGRRCYQLFHNAGVTFSMEIPMGKKVEGIVAFAQSLIENGTQKYVPLHRGWFIQGDNAEFFQEENTWISILEKRDKQWRL